MNKELLNRIEKLETEAKELREQLKEKKRGRWKPEEGEEYFFVNEEGHATCDKNDNHEFDKTRILIGNCYKTKELAERQIEKEKLITEIWGWWDENDGVELDWEDENVTKHQICKKDNRWHVIKTFYWQSVSTIPYFSSEELAEACIKHFKNRLKILLTKRWEE